MLQGAYKKLKSYYFYDKTLLFIKRKIAEFEADDNRFEKAFDILANKLISEDISYFEKLIEQLDYQVFPKSFVATSQTKAIVGAIDHHKNIGKVNFFIDIPIELLIIDHELSFDFLDPKEIYAKKKSTVLKRLRKNLRERLRTSISMALALDYRWKTSTSNQDSNIELARKFRKSNIFNHNLVSFPLLNYLPFEQISTCSFLEIQQDPWNNFDSFTLSKERLFWTPRFIHLDELSIYYFMQSTQDIHKNFNGTRNIKKIWIDTLFVPQLNKDTNYFSSIVESTSRDLHCFIVQANTSKYGDSRITAPYDTIHRNIVQIKGGINDLVIIGELELDKVRTARKQYEDNRNKIRLHCFDCKKVKKANYPNYFIACRTCRYHTEKQFVKDIPAHFE